MAKKPVSKEQKAFRFYNTAAGHLVLAVIIWFVGFNLLLLATDTGSLLQWGGVVISLVWGLYHFSMSVQMFVKKVWQRASKSS
jgi:F0F1-type ATP synthase membrane subunit a